MRPICRTPRTTSARRPSVGAIRPPARSPDSNAGPPPRNSSTNASSFPRPCCESVWRSSRRSRRSAPVANTRAICRSARANWPGSSAKVASCCARSGPSASSRTRMPCAARAPNCCVCARWPARASSGRAGTPSWRNTSHARANSSRRGTARGTIGRRDLRRLEIVSPRCSARAARGRRLMLLADVRRSAQRCCACDGAGPRRRRRAARFCRVARALPQTIDRLAEDESRLRHALTGAEDALTRADNQQRDLASQLAALAAQVRFPRANHSTRYANAAMRSGACCVAACRWPRDVTHAARTRPRSFAGGAFRRAMVGSDESPMRWPQIPHASPERQLANDLGWPPSRRTVRSAPAMRRAGCRWLAVGLA